MKSECAGGQVNPAVVVDPARVARCGGSSRSTATTTLGISAARHVSTVEVVCTNRVKKCEYDLNNRIRT